MKSFDRAVAFSVSAAVAVALTASGLACTRRPAAAPGPAHGAATASVPNDSLARARQQFVDQVAKQIVGRESEPATAVFKNVQALTFQVTATQLLRGMELSIDRLASVATTATSSVAGRRIRSARSESPGG